ncbi:MAG: peptidase U32 family protein [Methanomicrobiales archaeon]
MVKIIELLAPSKDFTSLNSAIKNGANSIYIGVEGCNMRANVSNFKIHEIKEAVKICHDQDVKLYVCTNTIMKDRDITYLKKLYPILHSMDIDAVILSDLGALKLAKDNHLQVHMSVQSNLTNSESLNFIKSYGVKRAILSRELSLEEIKTIINNTNMEIEVFVHGAMCMAVSGRCFLSSYLYNKSANCGECLQPCRKQWKLISEDLEEVQLETDENFTYFISPYDLCMIEHIPELVKAGIHAFKIEGRARPAEYVAAVTRVYRDALNLYEKGNWVFDKNWLIELKKVYNRGFDTGFYFKSPHESSSYNQSTYLKKDVGTIVNYYPQVSAAEVRLWNEISIGDQIIIQGPTTGSIIQNVESMQINGENVTKAQKGENVGLKVREKVRKNDLVYLRIPRKS